MFVNESGCHTDRQTERQTDRQKVPSQQVHRLHLVLGFVALPVALTTPSCHQWDFLVSALPDQHSQEPRPRDSARTAKKNKTMFMLDYRENQKKRKGVLLIAVAFIKHPALQSKFRRSLPSCKWAKPYTEIQLFPDILETSPEISVIFGWTESVPYEKLLPSFSVPVPRLVFAAVVAAWIAYRLPLSDDQAPSSVAFEPLSPKNTTTSYPLQPMNDVSSINTGGTMCPAFEIQNKHTKKACLLESRRIRLP